MLKIKKLFFKLLCHPLVGRIIFKVFHGNILDIRWRGRYVMPPDLDPILYASLFWGFYESAEKRIINKYLLDDFSVIELGASLGIVSNHISRKLKAESLHVMVEMNSLLIPFIKNNHRYKLKNQINAIYINEPINYERDRVQIRVGRNTTESVVVEPIINIENSIFMHSTQLYKLYDTYLKNNDFTLVCDIEGAEIQILLNDYNCLLKCRHLIIELHDTHYHSTLYSISDMTNIIINDLNFTLVDRDGNVFYFKKLN